MARPLKIVVSRKHIAAGMPNTPYRCPIALALKEALVTDCVNVQNDSFTVNNRRYEMTEDMRRVVRRFDEGRRKSPYTFFLERK